MRVSRMCAGTNERTRMNRSNECLRKARSTMGEMHLAVDLVVARWWGG